MRQQLATMEEKYDGIELQMGVCNERGNVMHETIAALAQQVSDSLVAYAAQQATQAVSGQLGVSHGSGAKVEASPHFTKKLNELDFWQSKLEDNFGKLTDRVKTLEKELSEAVPQKVETLTKQVLGVGDAMNEIQQVLLPQGDDARGVPGWCIRTTASYPDGE